KLAVVASLAGKVAITHVEPEVVHAVDGRATFTISGQNFAKDTPDDIRLLINNSEQDVSWENGKPKPASVQIKGKVKSTTELELSDVPIKEGKVVLAI